MERVNHYCASQDIFTSAEEVAHYGGNPVEIQVIPQDAIRVEAYVDPSGGIYLGIKDLKHLEWLEHQTVDVIVMRKVK